MSRKMIEVLVPTAEASEGPREQISTRPRTVRGTRVGLFGNGKPNVRPLFESLAREFEKLGAERVVVTGKPVAARPAEPEELGALIGRVDLAVVGVGD